MADERLFTAGFEQAQEMIWEALQSELRKGGYSPEATPTLWRGFQDAVMGVRPVPSDAVNDPNTEPSSDGSF